MNKTIVQEIYISPRLEEKFLAACEFVKEANIEQRLFLLHELMLHNPALVWNPKIKSLDEVREIAVNGDYFQLNLDPENE